ncbi:MAG: 30S ribosomal protein S9 [Candidatus Hodarchaeales archaeon]|jgi:small subunit ribosomal protein S9
MKVKLTSGKRRRAIARAVTYPGKGRIWLNSRPIEIHEPELMRMKVFEPLIIAGEDIRKKMDIKVKVKGGGMVSQTEAARTAIARALVTFTESEELRQKMRAYDRTMLSGDPRRKEAKKFGRKGARAKYTKSYR